MRAKYDDGFFLRNPLFDCSNIWRSWHTLVATFGDDTDRFLERGSVNFSDEFVDEVYPVVMHLVKQNSGWDIEFLIETAKRCLLLRKVAGSFMVILKQEHLSPPTSKLDLLLKFEEIRKEIDARLNFNTDPEDIELILQIRWDFMRGIFMHDSKVVQNYFQYGTDENIRNSLFAFLRFSNERYWTSERLENARELPTLSFHWMSPVPVRAEEGEEDPFLSHCRRIHRISEMWFEQVARQDGGREFLEFVQGNDFEMSRDWLKKRRKPRKTVSGWPKYPHTVKRDVVSMQSQVARIKILKGNLSKGPNARVFNRDEHADIDKWIGQGAKIESQAELERQAERVRDYETAPPPEAALPAPPRLSQFGDQESQVPITQSVEEKCEWGDEETLGYIESLVNSLVKKCKVEWNSWTLIPGATHFETNDLGSKMMSTALEVFLSSLVEVTSGTSREKLLRWLQTVDEVQVFEISRAVILFFAAIFRFSHEGVVKTKKALDLAAPMAGHFYWDLVIHVGVALHVPARARWFWRLTASMIGRNEMTHVIDLWRKFDLSRDIDIEESRWKGFAEKSPEIMSDIGRKAQLLVDLIKADSMFLS